MKKAIFARWTVASVVVGLAMAGLVGPVSAQTTVTVPTVNTYDPTSGVLATLTPYIGIAIALVLGIGALAVGPKLAQWAIGKVTGFFRARKASV